MTRGSVVNQILNEIGIPQEGMGATMLYHSDRRAGTVIRVVSFASGPNKGNPRLVYVQEDSWKLVSGSVNDGSAVYEFSQDLHAPVREFRWTGKRWSGPCRISFGDRDHYVDPGF